MTQVEIREIVRCLGQVEAKVDRAIHDIDELRVDVARNNEQLKLWKAIRIVIGWLVGTSIALFGAAKGVEWFK